MPNSDKKPNTYHIFVNKTKYDVTASSMTGEQILALAGFTPDKYDLFHVHGHDQIKIEPNQSVQIQNGMKFQAILRNIQFG